MTDPLAGKYPKPEEWVSTQDPSTGSEFGGVPGLVQPAPHDMTDVPHETANYIKSIPAAEYVDGAWVSTYPAPATELVRP